MHLSVFSLLLNVHPNHHSRIKWNDGVVASFHDNLSNLWKLLSCRWNRELSCCIRHGNDRLCAVYQIYGDIRSRRAKGRELQKKAALTVCSVAAETNSILSADSLSPPTKNKKILGLQTAVGAINLLTFVTSSLCVWQHIPEFVRMLCSIKAESQVRFLSPQNVSGASHKNQDEVFLLLFSSTWQHEDGICTQSEVESFAVGGSLSSELPQWGFFFFFAWVYVHV